MFIGFSVAAVAAALRAVAAVLSAAVSSAQQQRTLALREADIPGEAPNAYHR
jgi:hypothetical protein